MASQGLWSETLIDKIGALDQTLHNRKTAAAAILCIVSFNGVPVLFSQWESTWEQAERFITSKLWEALNKTWKSGQTDQWSVPTVIQNPLTILRMIFVKIRCPFPEYLSLEIPLQSIPQAKLCWESLLCLVTVKPPVW